MANILLANNATSLLAASITAIETVVQTGAGDGALFPSPGGTQFFYATLEDNAGNVEVVKCTSRTGDLLTVVRGQDNTTAKAFTLTITRIELRLTTAVFSELVQSNGGLMTGALDFNGNAVTDAVLGGPLTQILAGETVAVPMRGVAGQTTNELIVPASGNPTVGGVPILVTGDDIVALLDIDGVIILNSATIGVRIPAGAFLRTESPDTTNWLNQSAGDIDYTFSFTGITDALWLGANLSLGAGVIGKFNDETLERPHISDFSVQRQAVVSAATLTIDYSLGQYVEVAMGINIVTFDISNPPATARYGALQIKFTQDVTGGRTIVWPAKVKFSKSRADEIALSVAPNAVDFVDLWTDDFGTTWYASGNTDWA